MREEEVFGELLSISLSPPPSAKNGGVHNLPFKGSSLEESSRWGDGKGGDAAWCALWEGGQRPPAQAQEPGLS